jgi:hypothetical protein
MPGRVDSRIDTPRVSAIGGERRGVVRVPEFDAAVPGGREEGKRQSSVCTVDSNESKNGRPSKMMKE